MDLSVQLLPCDDADKRDDKGESAAALARSGDVQELAKAALAQETASTIRLAHNAGTRLDCRYRLVSLRGVGDDDLFRAAFVDVFPRHRPRASGGGRLALSRTRAAQRGPPPTAPERVVYGKS